MKSMNEEQIKKRLIGSVVVVLTIVIVVPIFLDGSDKGLREVKITEVPPKASFEMKDPPNKLFDGDGSLDFIKKEKGSTVFDLNVGGIEGVNGLEGRSGKVLNEIIREGKNVKVVETFEKSLKKLEKQIGDRLNREGTVEEKSQVLVEWLVQVGSFSDLTNAERLVSQLTEDSFEAVTLERGNENGRSFKVRVGPYKNKSNAHKALLEIEKKHTVSGFLVKVSP